MEMINDEGKMFEAVDEETGKKDVTKERQEECEQNFEQDGDDDKEEKKLVPIDTLEEMHSKLDAKLLGLPKIFKGIITIGPYMAMSNKPCHDISKNKDLSILDCPSQVVPLLVKSANKFPAKLQSARDVNSQPATSAAAADNKLATWDFYSSSIGKLLIGIGLSQAKQVNHRNAIRLLRYQIQESKESEEGKESKTEYLMKHLRMQKKYFKACCAANAVYHFPTKKCEQCNFRYEFQIVLSNHLKFPHMNNFNEYKCNYCKFSARNAPSILKHVKKNHERKCLIERALPLHECPICPYESGSKLKATTHINKCIKIFLPEKLLSIKNDCFPTITPKPITKLDITIYEATMRAIQCLEFNLTIGMCQLQKPEEIMKAISQKQSDPSSSSAAAGKQMIPFSSNQMNLLPQFDHKLSNSASLIPRFQVSGNQHESDLLGSANVTAGAGTLKELVCEICGMQMENLNQLPSHLHSNHKIQINPKMLTSRPPLGCQKCPQRFFTQPGLEGHLLYTHGFVTPGMQEMEDQNQERVRCNICGQFITKLIAHLSQIHHMSLKRASIIYKCSVCSAVFNLYQLLESHVRENHMKSMKRERSSNNNDDGPKRKRGGDGPMAKNK